MTNVTRKSVLMRALLALAVTCAVLAPTAPAAAQQLPFTPPKGWTQQEPPAGFLGLWVKPAGDNSYAQTINVYGHSFDGSLSDFYAFSIRALKKRFPGGDVAVSQDTTVCGGRAAKYISYAVNTNAGPMIVEQIMTVSKGNAYFVTYIRLAGQESDANARHSMTTICGI